MANRPLKSGWIPLPDKDPAPPLRNQNYGYGTVGKNIPLTTNHFEVQFKTFNVTLYHYDVVIKDFKDEEGLPKVKKMEIFEKMQKSNRKTFGQHPIAYDKEKSAYSVGPIPGITQAGAEFEVNLEVEGRSSRFKVTLKEVARANLQELMKAMNPHARLKMPSHIYQMLEILFRHYRSVRYVQVGQRCFFPKEPEFGRHVDLTMGKQGVVGFFSSLRPAAWKDGSVLLNIDVSNTAFYKEQPVLQFVKDVLQLRDEDFRRPLRKEQEKALTKELKGLKVRVTHSQIPRTYRVNKVMPLGAAKQKFTLEDKDKKANKTKQVTVKEYFQSNYDKQIKYDELNLLHCGPMNKEIYLSMEYLVIEKGQKVQKKLSPNELKSFIQSTAVPPIERLRRIQQIAEKNRFNEDPLLRALQANVEGAPLSVQGKVLPPVHLKMKEDRFPTKQGVWDVRNKRFDTAAEVDPWAVLNYAGPRTTDDTVWKFINTLTKMGKELGMTIGRPSYGAKRPNDPSRDLRELKNKQPNLKIVLVIIGFSDSTYAQVKKAGDVEVGLMTQCVKQINVYKCAPATISNILLKINAKVGGTNNVIDLHSRPVVLSKPVIFLGADVNHPASRDHSTPSLAAVVGSMDKFASQYEVEVRNQECRKEVIVDLRDMTKSLLKTFYGRTRCKPERIIMFRDGVSESQFAEVLSYELKAIREACTQLEASYTPAVTFIVVQKRHHTRLFCNERDSVGRSKNIPPGTTVDKGITHPYERDFFLCSHQGIQGTSKPSHYHVLWDDSDMTADQLQLMTYAMCHLYSRCTRSVSIPTPAYYAHLAAYRAKVHLTDLVHSDSGSLASGGEAGHIPDAEIMRAIKIDETFPTRKKMYFL